MWRCEVCGKWVHPNSKGEPASNYWKGSPTHWDKVYCSPECSLKHYQETNKAKENP